MCIRDSWPIYEHSLKDSDLSDNFEFTSTRNRLSNISNTRIKLNGDWSEHQLQYSSKLWQLVNFVFQLTTLGFLELDLNRSNLTDEGCAAIALTLQNCPFLSSLHLQMTGTYITDEGISFISDELYRLPLKDINLNLDETKLTDQSLFSLSASLHQLASDLETFILRLANTQVTDFGIIDISNTLSSFSSLSRLCLLLYWCNKVTDKFGERLADQIPKVHGLTHVTIDFRRTSVTLDVVNKIRRQKTPKHLKFDIYVQ
eukprot:TRINITY_DN6042_c0_g2_i1.p1 TRINITY_DN6042_c0_g2~~TRINITY_DN6042_c0_g2_i1.p1  ORF type:complete len:277 (+),score=25.23 TRINITY_DN6042_c0_g2_i1:60-833(+)